jgi:hypothetical protein
MEAAVTLQPDELYEDCRKLFTAYPLAVESCDEGEAARSMALVVRREGHAEFFLLEEAGGQAGEADFAIRGWHDEMPISIGASAELPDALAEAIAAGTPIPRDGSLFGWQRAGRITALVVTYTQQTPETPEPSWAVMPLLGSSEATWPPFTTESLLGGWFWDQYRAGQLVLLDEVIARSADTVFWADTETQIGSNCVAVARDLTTGEGQVLPRGLYAYHQALTGGAAVPSLDTLLADGHLDDLAPQFA